MLDRPVYRITLIIVLLGVLFGLFVLYGAGVGQPDGPPYGEDELAGDAATYQGEHVEVSGVVVDTDPVVVEAWSDEGPILIEVVDTPEVTIGEELILAGEYAGEGTVVAESERAVTREPWERTYMFAISAVGIAFVAGRILNEWRFAFRPFVFIPREQTLLSRYLDSTVPGRPRGVEHDG